MLITVIALFTLFVLKIETMINFGYIALVLGFIELIFCITFGAMRVLIGFAVRNCDIAVT